MIQKILSLYIFILLTFFSFYSNAQSYRFLYYPLPTGDAGFFAQCYSTCTTAPYCSDSTHATRCVCTDMTGSSLCYTANFTCGSLQTATCTGGHVCQSGYCVCPSGQTECPGGLCKNLSSDNQNCGTCGNPCTNGHVCQGGKCVCPSGLTDCSGVCTNLASDNSNCGKCANPCNTANGQKCCSSFCVDTLNNENDCGGCGVSCITCSLGDGCKSGSCAVQSYRFLFENPSTGCAIGYKDFTASSSSEASQCAQTYAYSNGNLRYGLWNGAYGNCCLRYSCLYGDGSTCTAFSNYAAPSLSNQDMCACCQITGGCNSVAGCGLPNLFTPTACLGGGDCY